MRPQVDGWYPVRWAAVALGGAAALAAGLLGGTAGASSTNADGLIRAALTQVRQKTSVPLEGPAGLPARSSRGYLDAVTQATADSYNIGLQWATTPLPINSRKLDEPPNTGLAAIFGSFGGAVFRNRAEAGREVTLLTGYWVAPPRTRPTTVTLAPHIRGELWRQDHGLSEFVIWRQGSWQCEVQGVPDVGLARALARALGAKSFPWRQAPGALAVEDAGDGEHTQLAWAHGRVVYFVGNYHDAREAVHMAEAMESLSRL